MMLLTEYHGNSTEKSHGFSTPFYQREELSSTDGIIRKGSPAISLSSRENSSLEKNYGNREGDGKGEGKIPKDRDGSGDIKIPKDRDGEKGSRGNRYGDKKSGTKSRDMEVDVSFHGDRYRKNHRDGKDVPMGGRIPRNGSEVKMNDGNRRKRAIPVGMDVPVGGRIPRNGSEVKLNDGNRRKRAIPVGMDVPVGGRIPVDGITRLLDSLPTENPSTKGGCPLHSPWFIPLLIALAGLPQLSETLYTPALPTLAAALNTSAASMEYTLTVYLMGFTLGTLCWGWLSDNWGRKPCCLGGLMVFIWGCVGCALSDSWTSLMIFRGIQGFGGSIGSVLAQSMCRDAFSGVRLSRVYASISQALAVFPALGPVVGSLMVSWVPWPSLFWLLGLVAVLLSGLFWQYGPETHPREHRKKIPGGVALRMMRDKKVWAFGGIVAGCNGIAFSYFAEAPFYMVEHLGLGVQYYGLSFLPIGLSLFLGGAWAKRQNAGALYTLHGGLGIMVFFTALSSIVMVLQHFLSWASPTVLIASTLLCQMGIGFGICMTTSVALALALGDYRSCVGRASSFFGFFYYGITALITAGMGFVHNGTLLPMPLYFFGISAVMGIIAHTILPKVEEN